MGLNLLAVKPTKAQLGAANDPDLHLARNAARPSYAGDNFDAANDLDSPAVHPSYRTVQYAATPQFPSSDATLSGLAAAHAQRGPVNPRQTFTPTEGPAQAGSAITPTPYILVAGEQIHDDLLVPADAGQISWPDRYRAGGTSADTTRTARRSIWYYLRPFDKGIADRFMTGRYAQSSPLASQPPTFRAPITNPAPSAGGHAAAPGMSPVGIQPNSSRLLPNAWDQDIYNPQQANTVDASANYGADSRASGWRAG